MREIGCNHTLHRDVVVFSPFSEDEVDLLANILLLSVGRRILGLLRTLHYDLALAHLDYQVFAVELTLHGVVDNDDMPTWLDEASEYEDVPLGYIVRWLVHGYEVVPVLLTLLKDLSPLLSGVLVDDIVLIDLILNIQGFVLLLGSQRNSRGVRRIVLFGLLECVDADEGMESRGALVRDASPDVVCSSLGLLYFIFDEFGVNVLALVLQNEQCFLVRVIPLGDTALRLCLCFGLLLKPLFLLVDFRLQRLLLNLRRHLRERLIVRLEQLGQYLDVEEARQYPVVHRGQEDWSAPLQRLILIQVVELYECLMRPPIRYLLEVEVCLLAIEKDLHIIMLLAYIAVVAVD